VHCPFCSHSSTRVVESRLTDPGSVRRRRECNRCGERFTTYERAEAVPLTVLKRDGRREQFDRQKLLRGLVRAANKRPVSEAALEELADSIAARVRARGRSEVEASLLGELSLRGLAELDPVTGLLFASVYRNFRDLSELEAELQRIRSEPVAGDDQLALDQPASAAPDPSDPAASIDPSPRTPRRGRRQAESDAVLPVNKPAPDVVRVTRRSHAAQP
jgi:transcriptional repressor NrdR